MQFGAPKRLPIRRATHNGLALRGMTAPLVGDIIGGVWHFAVTRQPASLGGPFGARGRGWR
jgi:hypothetical protein